MREGDTDLFGRNYVPEGRSFIDACNGHLEKNYQQ